MNLKSALAAYTRGKLTNIDLPTVALNALVEGYDSPALCQLAVAQDHEVERLFRVALEELGLELPALREACITSACAVAKDVLAGRTTPYHGARKIWWISHESHDLNQLTVFIALACEYEEKEGSQTDSEIELAIVSECQTLLASEAAQHIKLIHFENTKAADCFLERIGVNGTLGVFLAEHLTQVLRLQYPNLVIESIEFTKVGNCSGGGMATDTPNIIHLSELSLPFYLCVMVLVDKQRCLLHLQTVVNAELNDGAFNVSSDVHILRQTDL